MENGFRKIKQSAPTIKAGDIFTSNNHGEFEVITYISSRDVKVKFLDTGAIGYASSGAIRRGSVVPYKPS